MNPLSRNFAAPQAAYVHIPFCLAKCHYCEFNSYPGMEASFAEYVRALELEISRVSAASRLSTIYFGGGTPTMLTAEQLHGILRLLVDRFGLIQDSEITIEANPGTVDSKKLSSLRNSGFNRLSLGVQSLDDAMLETLGRAHSVQDALEAYDLARKAAFDNISLDLMFALPGQNLEDWKRTLGRIVKLYPEHVSLYELSIEEGSRFAQVYAPTFNSNAYASGKPVAILPDENAKVEMYQVTIDTLTAAGYEHYEVSNFARPGYRSRHNQVYWRNEPYYGFGAGATGYVDGVRYTNLKQPEDYMKAIARGDSPVETSEIVSRETSMGETIMLALRTKEGLHLQRFKKRYDAEVLDIYPCVISQLTQTGLLEVSSQSIRLTHKGLLLTDEVAEKFLP